MEYTDIPLEDCRTGDEGAMLPFVLDRVHRQFAWKSGGLTSEHLGTRRPPSGLAVAGTMVRLAKVEELWTAAAAGRVPGPPVIGTDGEAHYDADYVVNRRRRLVDMLDQNLLHTGQTSIIREAVDGLVGDDPP
ncbi:MAG TPA: hypothetical protein VFU98_18565 [Microlunatus sp.]|nr:hypothetical protein [Microlunatus sp.]